MNFYEKHILPPILNCACGLSLLKRHREDIVSRARGKVLEIGIGSSLNLDFYKLDQITEITGTQEQLVQKVKDKLSQLVIEQKYDEETLYRYKFTFEKK